MTTAAPEKTQDKAFASATIPAASAAQLGAAPRTITSKTKLILAGFDLGTNKSCVLAGAPASTDLAVSKIVPSVVGYVKEGIVNGIISGNAPIVYGEEALRCALHVDLVPPLAEGVIARPEAARDFLKHIREVVDPSGQAEIRAVVGIPANAGEAARDDIRRCAQGVFDRILLIPEPFLAALGYRDDSRVRQPGYVDPVTNSLFIDIGGGTSDLCLVQGYFPTPDDQISVPFAGDGIDRLLHESLDRTYPQNGFSRQTVREIKEANAYVGPSRKPLDVKVVIGGKGRTIELGDMIANACNTLIDRIYQPLITLIERASSDSVVALLQNIIVTGGGSQIRGIDLVLQKRLADDGYESPKVRLAGQDFKRYVALGALKAARAARENQWQVLLG
ncbi:MAG: rod shape-determining protein [Opitutaceae bacterium]